VNLVSDFNGEKAPTYTSRRILPLFSQADIYLHFLAWFDLENIDHPPSRQVFCRGWHGSWPKVIQIRDPSDHKMCQTRFELHSKTYDKWAPLSEKMIYARWLEHLRSQYLD
jgi:hypothetical protein